MSVLKQVGLFSIGLLGMIGATWLGKLLAGSPYQFPDGWILGIGIGLAAVVGARFKTQTSETR